MLNSVALQTLIPKDFKQIKIHILAASGAGQIGIATKFPANINEPLGFLR